MNNKGVTMVTVIVMIIVMLIIATVSIVAGNKIIVSSKEYKVEQELQSVKAAVLRKKSEVNMAGTLIPVGESYVGIKDPILKNDETGTLVATGWYLLDEENLEKLGVYDVSTRYIANYDYEEVLSTQDTDYIELYMVIEFMYEYIDMNSVAGEMLKNKSDADSSGKMVKNKDTGDLYGTGWYLLKKNTSGSTGDFPAKYSSYINHDYLINFNTAKYVKVTSDFEEI